MKTLKTHSTASYNRELGRVRIHIDEHEAQILVYALRHFAKEFSTLDDKARTWAEQMAHLAHDINNALQD